MKLRCDSIQSMSKKPRALNPLPIDARSAKQQDEVWIDLCALKEMTPGLGHYVSRDNKRLAVMLTTERQIHVIDDACPHAGGSLASGGVDEIDGQSCAVCPWHGWAFDLKTGQCPDNPIYRVSVYPTRVVRGRVEVKL